MTTPTRTLLLALVLAAGANADDGYLRRLQPSALPPLGAPAPTRPARPEPTPPRVRPGPVASVSSPYGAGEVRYDEPHGEVLSVDVHPGGNMIAAAASDRRVHIWELSHSIHWEVPLPGGGGQHVRFSPDGEWLAALGLDTSSGVTLIPVGGSEPGAPVQLAEGGGFSNQVAFSPDSRRMAVDGYNKVLIYDIPASGPPSAQPSLELPSATGSFIRAEFSQDGRYLVVASHEGKVQSWRTDTWERLGVWDIPKARYSAGRPYGLVMTGLGRQAWVLTTSQLIALDYTTGTWSHAQPEVSGYTLAPRPGGRTLAIGQIDGAVLLVDPTDGSKVLRLEGHREQVEAAAFLPDGRLVTGSDDGSVVLWRVLPEAELVGRGPNGPLPRVSYPFRTSVPRRGQPSPRIAVEDLPNPPERESTDGTGACWSPDSRYLARGYSGKLRIHAGAEPKPTLVIDRLSGEGRVTAWFPDSTRVATIDKGFVRVYAVPGGASVAAWELPGGWDHHVAVFPDGGRLARAGSRDVAVHDVATGKVLLEFEALGAVEAVSSPRIHAFDVSPDGQRLLTGGDDGTLRVWDASNARLLAEAPMAHDPSVLSARYLPDGRLVSTGQDGLVRWWSADLEVLRQEEGHLGEGHSVAVLARERVVLSGGRDGAVIFWDLEGTKQLRLDSDLEAIDYLAPSPDGKWLLIASEADGSMLLPLPTLLAQRQP